MAERQERRLQRLEARLSAIEARMNEGAIELTTRRIRIIDAGGHDRVIGEVIGDTAEFRVQNPTGTGGEVVLFASPAGGPDTNGDPGPWLGIDVRSGGDTVESMHFRT